MDTTKNSTTSSEKDKMMAGVLYKAFDAELLQERQRAKEICFRLNQTSPVDVRQRRAIIAELLLLDGHDVHDDTAHIESPFHVDYGYNLKIGRNFYANHGCTILDGNLITIGDNCLLAPHVVISAATHPLDGTLRAGGWELTAPVTIGDNVWIGANATINPGVTLGDNVVVGAGAVVTKSFPANVVVAGVPAVIIRQIPVVVDDDKQNF
jgi:maltose O-acetyltransferase